MSNNRREWNIEPFSPAFATAILQRLVKLFLYLWIIGNIDGKNELEFFRISTLKGSQTRRRILRMAYFYSPGRAD